MNASRRSTTAFGWRFLAGSSVGSGAVALTIAVVQLACFTDLPGASVRATRAPVRDRTGALLLAGRDTRAREYEALPEGIIGSHAAAALIASEDHRIATHPGVDVLAVARAFADLVRTGHVRSGASTMAMQLVRLREGRRPGVDAWHKLRDVVLAVRLTRALGPAGIVRAYLDEVPLGPRRVGVEAAAWRTFGKSANALTVAESAVLATFARSPSSAVRAASSAEVRGTVVRRAERVLAALVAAGAARPDDGRAVPVVVGTLVSERPRGLPPAIAARVAAMAVGATTLDADLERHVDAALRAGLVAVRSRGISHGAALVVEPSSMKVRAAVARSVDGEVWFDAFAARRQPGSALKPFVVALGLVELSDDELMLRDAPLSFEGDDDVTEPRNYDGRFHGTVPVEDALARSLNVPVLRLAARLGAPRVLGFLQEFGFSSLGLPPGAYGVNLALGDGEVTMLELAEAYGALAAGGLHRPLVWSEVEAPLPTRRVVDENVARLVVQVLDDDRRRAPTFARDGVFAAPYPFAVKTGTSREHRDSWAIGFTRGVLALVWMGRADGGGTGGVTGALGPGPVLRAVVDGTHPAAEPFRGPDGRAWREVSLCLGEQGRAVAGEGCQRSPLVYRRSASTGPVARVPRDGAGDLLRRPGMPRFVFPADGARFLIDPRRPSAAQALVVLVDGPPTQGRWVVRDGSERVAITAGRTTPLPLTVGRHTLTLEVDGAVVDARSVRVDAD